jgi:UDP-N-acetylglucosamine 2-epimerase
MKLMTVLGTRPEIIKLSSLLPLFDKNFQHTLVHTGQHYSYELDRVFFEELELRNPDFALDVGSSDILTQTAAIMSALAPVIEDIAPDMIVVQGDTNTTMAGALAAAKTRTKLAHVEAGARSFNKDMPEEYNRIVADHVADILFPPFEYERENLLREGLPDKKIVVTGGTLVEACRRMLPKARQSKILERLDLKPGEYVLATIHRAESTNYPSALKGIFSALSALSEKIEIVIPIHPRTAKALKHNGFLLDKRVSVIEPLGYTDFLNILSNAKFAMTDSGGVQEEAPALNVPALVLRSETELVYYIEAGKNKLVGRDKETIVPAALDLLARPEELAKMKQARGYLPDGAADIIIQTLLQSG